MSVCSVPDFPRGQKTCSQNRSISRLLSSHVRAAGWFDHVSALRDIFIICRMSPSPPGAVFAHTHALAQTVGGTWRISKDAAVSCAGAWLCAPARGKEEQKHGSVTREKGRERAEPPCSGKNTRSFFALTGMRHSAAYSLWERRANTLYFSLQYVLFICLRGGGLL